MVIDATEAAARFEIVATQRDHARFEASVTGAPEATALAAKLDVEYERQKNYVDKLARIVDTASSGAVTDAGAAAMRGTSMRDSGDISAAELADALIASGMDIVSVERVVGATELAVEQEKTAGGTVRLQEIAKATSEWTWTNRDNLRVARDREERRTAERRREEDRQLDDRRAEKRSARKRQDENAAAQRSHSNRVEVRVAADQAAQQHQSERRAEFGQWLVQLAAQAEQRSA